MNSKPRKAEKWRQVSQAEFEQFVRNYPNPLTTSISQITDPPTQFLDDFTTDKVWPESSVAMVKLTEGDTRLPAGTPNEFYLLAEQEAPASHHPEPILRPQGQGAEGRPTARQVHTILLDRKQGWPWEYTVEVRAGFEPDTYLPELPSLDDMNTAACMAAALVHGHATIGSTRVKLPEHALAIGPFRFMVQVREIGVDTGNIPGMVSVHLDLLVECAGHVPTAPERAASWTITG